MNALVLTTRPADNLYGDTAQTYSFPPQYLRWFAPLLRGEEMVAVLYEPRRGHGRESYVAWVTLREPPHPDPANPSWWRITYEGGVQPFARLVPRLHAGNAFEALLRQTPLRQHGSVLQGRSVREIDPADLLSIFEHAGLVATEVLPAELETPEAARQRQERLVLTLKRDRGFRRRVLEAYDYRCAVTGWGYVDGARFAQGGLVDAAHVRPVGDQHGGGDEIANGIALTPSVHRLFDAGLFTLAYQDSGLWVRVSSELRLLDLAPMGAFPLPLLAGQTVRLPADSGWQPLKAHLEYHAAHVFRP